MQIIKKIIYVLIALFFLGFVLFKYPNVGTGLNELKDWLLSDPVISNTIEGGKQDLDDYINSGEYPKLVKNTINVTKDTATSILVTVKEMFKDDINEYTNNYKETAISFVYNGVDVNIPAYSGNGVVELGKSTITSDQLDATSFEYYGNLDQLGRVTYALANVSTDLEPIEGEQRGDISKIKPTGWVQKKYPIVIEDMWLYNRCHLIGWQLTGENANKKNLMTGTRYMNLNMLTYENRIAAYVGYTDNHVLYKATPIFVGNNLLAHGVMLEARSVENDDINFLVYVYNVQPNIELDYATGDSKIKAELE